VARDHGAIISDKMQPENAKFCCRKSQATVAISTYGLKFEIKVNQYDDKKLKHKIKQTQIDCCNTEMIKADTLTSALNKLHVNNE